MDLVRAAIGLIPIILSLSVHEWAHAWTAHRLGDDTAERQGRLTLNPASHVDPFGTIVLPLLLMLYHLPAFGWARPVPVDPTRFRRDVPMARGWALTASAGPISNLLLAAIAFAGLVVARKIDPAALLAQDVLWDLVILNVVLALFNLIPLPPLDGSRVVAWLLPSRFAQQWHLVERMAPIFLIVIFMFGGRIIVGPVRTVAAALQRLLNALT